MSEEMEFELAQQLNVLRSQPARNAAKAAQGRVAFLAQAQAVVDTSPLPVTNREQRRHIGWMHPLQNILKFQRKERSPMFGAIGTILLMISIVLGGSGITVAAAQNSLPNQALYPVKTWSEDIRTDIASSSQTRLQLALQYTSRRAEEMQVMLRAGQTPPETVQARMQAEVDLAIQLAAGQPDSDAAQAFQQIRQQLQVHEQQFRNLAKPADAQAEALLDRTRVMLQARLQLCEVGLEDPAMLRQQLRNRDQKHDGGITPSAPALVPSSTHQGNPWTTGTPTPGSSYGPGSGDGSGGNNPWTTGTPTPLSGYGPGPGAGAGSTGGNNPWTTGTPTPNSGYGPGPGSGSGSGAGGDSGGAGSGAGEPNSGGTSGGNPDDGNGPASGGGETGGTGTGSGSGSGSGGAGTGGSGGRH